MSLDRRSFLRSILPAAAGVIVAPTLAETLIAASKRYFFFGGVPKHGLFHDFSLQLYDKFQADVAAIELESFARDFPSLFALPYWSCPPDTVQWGGLSRTRPIKFCDFDGKQMLVYGGQ
jgi:hypothetical protein